MPRGMCECIFLLKILFSFPMRIHSEVELLGYMVDQLFICWETSILSSVWTNWHSHQQCGGLACHHILPRTHCPVFLMTAILQVWGVTAVALTCTSQGRSFPYLTSATLPRTHAIRIQPIHLLPALGVVWEVSRCRVVQSWGGAGARAGPEQQWAAPTRTVWTRPGSGPEPEGLCAGAAQIWHPHCRYGPGRGIRSKF